MYKNKYETLCQTTKHNIHRCHGTWLWPNITKFRQNKENKEKVEVIISCVTKMNMKPVFSFSIDMKLSDATVGKYDSIHSSLTAITQGNKVRLNTE